ncbi:murein biosynthesis integral membrane protein MurJ [Dictyobacter kobayashii]|uniref:murein biosynthesis integral membrane protein MurJ n=1 Tax=Dictyobacter kobayashii TaxID=2014872 RepID=UPI00248322C1|nr:murein biosynthesis integral membrane protein MurJ [Dictyobacter kobayashii]
MLEGAFLLMLALMASRVLGVVRQVIFNALFGVGPNANAYYAAARLPDTLYNLIAGGALISAFIPVFLAYEKEKGDSEAWRLTSLVFNLLLVLMTAVLLVGEFIAPAFVNNILIPGYSPAEKDLTITLTRIMLVQPLILGLGTVVTAILNSRRQFLLPAVSLAVYNVGLIGGLLVAKFVPGVGIYGPTYGTLVAVLLQLVVQLPGLSKQHVRYSFIWDLRHPGLRQVGILLLPNSLAIGVAYIGNIIDTHFTSYLPDSASLAALHNAEMLQALPVALIGQAVGQSLLPHLAMQAAAGRYIRMRQMALKVIGASIALTVPAALLLALFGKPMIHLLFQHGAFDPHASDLTNLALLGYACALPGLAAGNLLSGGFFALKDAWTPFITNTYALLVRWFMLYFLFQFLHGTTAILVVPLALAIAAGSEAIIMGGLLLFRLRRYIKRDKGMQRLEQRRRYLKASRKTPVQLSSDHE